MLFTITEAKTNLSKLIEKAVAGDEVIITKAGKPVVKLVPISIPEYVGKRVLGSARGTIKLKKGWDAPLTDKEMAEWFGL